MSIKLIKHQVIPLRKSVKRSKLGLHKSNKQCFKDSQYIQKEIETKIYNKKKLKAICSKFIFKRLLLKLATEVTFTINNFFKQTDGCAMGGPLSVTLSDIFMIKMKN